MRISDWSSDVCSSDLKSGSRHRPMAPIRMNAAPATRRTPATMSTRMVIIASPPRYRHPRSRGRDAGSGDRKSVVYGKGVSVRVDLGGRLVIKITIQDTYHQINLQIINKIIIKN